MGDCLYQELAAREEYEPLSGEEIRRLIGEAQRKWRQGDFDGARQIAFEVALRNLRFIIQIANEVLDPGLRNGPWISVCDLITIGIQAAVEAVFTFDLERSYEDESGQSKHLQFLSYAEKPIKIAMQNAIKAQLPPDQVPIESLTDDRGRPATIIDREAPDRLSLEDFSPEVRQKVYQALNKLPRYYRDLLIHNWGLWDGKWYYYPRESLDILAVDFNSTKERIRQGLEKAYELFKQAAEEVGLDQIFSAFDSLRRFMETDQLTATLEDMAGRS